jgi:hypothetical protein
MPIKASGMWEIESQQPHQPHRSPYLFCRGSSLVRLHAAMLKSSHLSDFDRSLECLESISYFLDLTSALRAQGAEWAGIKREQKRAIFRRNKSKSRRSRLD